MSSRESLRRVSRSLSGYLCGTHSGLLASRRHDRLDPDELARMHRALDTHDANTTIALGSRRWQPDGDARPLADALRATLAHPAIVDLVVFGSQARGGTTGFSDVDAILVIHDAAAEEPAVLRTLRRRVLAAQRAVLAHQPMQHHGFEIATPKLLGVANHALRLPAPALSVTRSVNGREIDAAFVPDDAGESRAALSEIVQSTSALPAWPRHAWRLHRVISMFELLPALYLQARGAAVPKWRSFEEARSDFGDAWWPYDALEQVRRTWRRRSLPALRAGAAALRNPWLAVAIWRRLPLSRSQETSGSLSTDCLNALQRLAAEMERRTC